MITQVSGISIPKLAFKGADEGNKPDINSKIEKANEKTDEFAKTIDEAGENIGKAAGSVAGATATTLGTVGIVKKSVKEAVDDETKSSVKKIINYFRKDVKTQVNEIGEDGVEVVKNVITKGGANWKRLGILGAVIAGIVGISVATKAIVSKVKKNKIKAEKENIKEEIVNSRAELEKIKKEIEAQKAMAGAEAQDSENESDEAKISEETNTTPEEE